MIRVVVDTALLDCGAALDWLASGGAGAVSSFGGYVRRDDGVSLLYLEHYPGMTEDMLGQIADAAAARWQLSRTLILHRVGAMVPGEQIVFVGAAAAHRRAALEACSYLIDRLKIGAPFWKRESRDGREDGWVEAQNDDEQAGKRWAQDGQVPG